MKINKKADLPMERSVIIFTHNRTHWDSRKRTSSPFVNDRSFLRSKMVSFTILAKVYIVIITCTISDCSIDDVFNVQQRPVLEQ